MCYTNSIDETKGQKTMLNKVYLNCTDDELLQYAVGLDEVISSTERNLYDIELYDKDNDHYTLVAQVCTTEHGREALKQFLKVVIGFVKSSMLMNAFYNDKINNMEKEPFDWVVLTKTDILNKDVVLLS